LNISQEKTCESEKNRKSLSEKNHYFLREDFETFGQFGPLCCQNQENIDMKQHSDTRLNHKDGNIPRTEQINLQPNLDLSSNS